MKIKKIPYYFLPWFLMAGASLTIGLLSFGGMLAILPVLPVAFASFVLSVAYEGEIYLQNIKGSIKKLFKANHFERQLAKACLLEYFPDESDASRPQFFKDYEHQLHLLSHFECKRLDKASQARKRHVEKTIIDMEKWFAVQLFLEEDGKTNYQKQLRIWLAQPRDDRQSLLDMFQTKHRNRRLVYQLVKGFCAIAGVFMGLGTTYLLVEAFTVIPWFAALSVTTWPVLIVPMASIAGIAYGLLVYNAITDMIANEFINKWWKRLSHYFSEPNKTVRNVVMGLGLALMFTLTLALSICTAGTWWTVAKTTRPLFKWMEKLPDFVMLVLNPLISSVSIWAFNLENVSETVGRIFDWFEPDNTDMPLAETSEQDDTENWLQQLNPFRLFINWTFNPLRKLFFLGHLISIGATADRAPGLSPFWTGLLGAFNEGIEDEHYFSFSDEKDHKHKHDTRSLLNARLSPQGGHNHNNDIPTQCLTGLYMPFYLLATVWDLAFSQENMSFGDALNKQLGIKKEQSVELTADDSCCGITASSGSIQSRPIGLFDPNFRQIKHKPKPLSVWQCEQAAYRIERHKKKQLGPSWFGEDIAAQQRDKLTGLQQELFTKSNDASLGIPVNLDKFIGSQVENNVYNQHQFFFYAPSGKTDTRVFLDGLSARVTPAA